VIFARNDRVGYTFSSRRIGWVPINSAELHQINASSKFRDKCLEQLTECLEQLVESLPVRPSACVFGWVPACLAKSLCVRSGPCVFGWLLACSAESLRVQSSTWVFGQVPGWPAYSFPGGNSRQHEAINMFNPRDSEVPLPPGRLQHSGWRVQLSVYTMQLLISNIFTLLLISVVSDMSEIFLNHIRKIRPPSGFTWQSDMFYDTWDFAFGW
jgi:hypothetical protein